MAGRTLKAEFSDSTSIKSAAYDLNTSVLTVTFKNKAPDQRATYRYVAVPKQEWDELTAAKSVGSYINKYIVGKYDEVVDEDEATKGRKALKLIRELVEHNDERNGSDKGFLSTALNFDRAWLLKARALLDE